MRKSSLLSDHVNLHPGDELSVTVDSSQLVSIVSADLDRPLTVNMRIEHGELNALRQKVQMLRSRVKQLTWHKRHDLNKAEAKLREMIE